MAALAGAVVLLTALPGNDLDRSRGVAEYRPAADPILRAATRIAAESRRGQARAPALTAPPRADGPGPVSGLPERPPPRPPSGYSFAEHRGEMATVRHRRNADTPSPPVPGDPDWLGSPEAVAALAAQAAAAGRDWSFGWIRLAADANPDELARALADSGAHIVGAPGRIVRARLPGDRARLGAIEALPAVDGLGAAPARSKLRGFPDAIAGTPTGRRDERVPVFVTLMADDAAGRWRGALQALGAEVGSYDATLRAYRANVTGRNLEALAARDFVLAVEPVGVVRVAHDTAVPAMGADALRVYDGSPGIFAGAGGASVPIAVMDTGLNVNHSDIASHRDSICGANFVGGEPDDIWIDENGHGTHVAGTFVGNGVGERRFAGMAPAVRHLRFAKVVHSAGHGDTDLVLRGMDHLADATACGGSAAVAPEIVNVSLGFPRPDHDGRGVGARKLDAMVWNHRQLYVVSQGNDAIRTYSEYAAAKNSLAVGAALDSGELAHFSSRGPTVDGRLRPNVVGTGVAVHSALGNGARAGYVRFNGTSMAAPSVAGAAALLMDASPAYRREPALVRARLMASAIRPDAWLDDATAFPAHNGDGPGALQNGYGLGKASARTAALDRDEPDGWTGGSATAVLGAGESAAQEIVVPQGAHRLDLVLTWDEPPAEAIAGSVLHDLDLWLDRGGDCGGGACGEYHSTSRVDNVEWIFVRDPQPGTYAATIVAERVQGAAPRAALAWTVVRGASTPTLSVSADEAVLEGPGEHEVTVTITSDAYVAAGARLHLDCDGGSDPAACDAVSFRWMSVDREDGISADLTKDIVCRSDRDVNVSEACISDTIDLGASIPIGEVALGEAQDVTFGVVLDGTPSARLQFTASAWNATAGSASVRLGTWTSPAAARPSNDDFGAATPIEGGEGHVDLDLLRATPQPGEPALSIDIGLREPAPSTSANRDHLGRPAGSAWYAWTAPSNGSFHFRLVDGNCDGSGRRLSDRNERVDVFAGASIAALDRLGSGWGGGSVFALRDDTYLVRVGSFGRGRAMRLCWSPHAGPDNDDFAAAKVLEEDRGRLTGSNVGATLEPGEWLGGMAATTWYRFTAPRDEDWRFVLGARQGEARILAFEGDGVASLRLVSGHPGAVARFPARAGAEYHIAVALNDAYVPAGAYEFWWDSGGTRRSQPHNSFRDASSLGDAASSNAEIRIDRYANVDPLEPVETGVRTQWWVWDAPADAGFTWRLDPVGRFDRRLPIPLLTAFAPGTATTTPEFADLDLLGRAVAHGAQSLKFEATAGRRYWFAAGFAARSDAAYLDIEASADLVWGRTPANDGPDAARALSGVSGSIAGDNRHATTTADGQAAVVGGSAVWFTYEARADGWLRFAVDVDGLVLVVHRSSTGGGLKALASSRWQSPHGRQADAAAATAVRFRAEAGVRYTISVGVDGSASGAEFNLDWAEAEAPDWLRYAGRVQDGDLDAAGASVEIRAPVALAVHASGTPVYLASGIGLQVFGRNPATGDLDLDQWIDADVGRSALLWDAQRERLLAEDCGTWRAFGSVAGGVGGELEDRGELTVAETPARCGDSLLADAAGSTIYRVGGDHVDLFSVDEAGGLRFVAGYEVAGARAAVIDDERDRVYALGDRALLVFARDSETGRLTRLDDAESPPLQNATALSLAGDGTYLFVLDGAPSRSRSPTWRTRVYGLQDGDGPRHLGTGEPFWPRPNYAEDADHPDNECPFVAARPGRAAIDAFCRSSAFSAAWNSEDELVEGADYLAHWQRDRHNNNVPDFGVPTALAAAPDGRHVFLATPVAGVLTFARDGADGADDQGTPDLAVQSQWASASAPLAGASITFSAVIRNRGDGPSQATTVRAYRSEDAVVSTSDDEVGSTEFGGLQAGATRSASVAVTVPETPGTYRFGLCVGAPPGESDASNNCSAPISVTVVADTRAPDLVVEASADPENVDVGGSFTLRATVANRGDLVADAATLRFYRSADEIIDTGDEEVGTVAVGALRAMWSRTESIELDGPSESASHYYGACADAAAGERETSNNCSAGVGVTFEEPGVPDLYMNTAWFTPGATLVAGEAFTMGGWLGNAGNRTSAATTLRVYRSEDTTINRDDTELGTKTVEPLPPGEFRQLESPGLTAPAVAGTYHYGFCVDASSGETELANNCTAAATLTVREAVMGQVCWVRLARSDGVRNWPIDPAQAEMTSTGTADVPHVQEGAFEGQLDGYGMEVDVYGITTESDRRLKVKAKGGLDTQAMFLRNDCVRAGRWWQDADWLDDFPDGDDEAYLVGNLGPGTYYLAVYTWAGATGDYELEIWTEDQPSNDGPALAHPGPDGAFEVGASPNYDERRVYFADDDGDWIVDVSFESADRSIAEGETTESHWDYAHSVEPRYEDPESGGVQRDYALYSVLSRQSGTTTITMTATDQRGASASWEVEVGIEVPNPSAPALDTNTEAGGFDIGIEMTLAANETRAYDVQIRERVTPRPGWATPSGVTTAGCLIASNDSDAEVSRTETVRAEVPENDIYEVRYRSRNSDSCGSGSPGPWSETGEVQSG